MNTKNCPKCGKELPQEAVFCPYCMTKLIDVNTGNEIKIKKKKSLMPILMISAVIAIIAIAVFALVIFSENSENTLTNPTTATIKESHSQIINTDYSNYIGLWSDKNNNIENLTENGGNLLEIISVNDNIVRFTFTKTSSPPYNRSNVTSKIIDDVGTFTFDDDNWQNSGTGKITFLGDEIYLETTVLNSNDSAMWDIGGNFYLTKSDSSVIDFESYNCLNENFSNIKNYFGLETKDVENSFDRCDIHTYSGFRVTVLKETNNIVGINVEYSSNALSKTQLCYGSINGNSTYDDVYAKLGEPTHNDISNGSVIYNIDGGTISFNFNDSMIVTGFILTTNELF